MNSTGICGKSHITIFPGDYKRFRIQPVTLEAFLPVVLEDEDMEFYPLKADHMIGIPTEIPNFFVFRVGKSWGMIANDTGFFREETWDFLEKKKFKLDLVISDCTGGILDIERGHMSGQYVLDVKKTPRKNRLPFAICEILRQSFFPQRKCDSRRTGSILQPAWNRSRV